MSIKIRLYIKWLSKIGIEYRHDGNDLTPWVFIYRIDPESRPLRISDTRIHLEVSDTYDIQ